MTPIQKFRVRESWTKVLPIQDVAAEIFYGRLFSIFPELAPLFKGDMQEQGEAHENAGQGREFSG